MRKIRVWAKSFAALPIVMLILICGMLNCTPAKFLEVGSPVSSKLSGNGGAYEGKPDPYYYFDSLNSCAQIGANGKSLPNKEIFLIKTAQGRAPQMVRDNCADLATPTMLPSDSLQFANDGSGDFSYNGDTFKAPKAVTDFDVVAANCPAGYIIKPSAIRKNMIVNSQDLLSPPWIYLTGVHGALDGSLGSLPRFEIIRDDPSALDFFKRVNQPASLQAGKTYAYTFFAQRGTVSEVYMSGWQSNKMVLNVYFDLTTGAGRDVGTTPGFSNLSFSSRSLAGGFIVTTFFTTSVAADNYIGVTPAPPAGPNGINDQPHGALGDSIFATAAQLEDVSNYCTKL